MIRSQAGTSSHLICSHSCDRLQQSYGILFSFVGRQVGRYICMYIQEDNELFLLTKNFCFSGEQHPIHPNADNNERVSEETIFMKLPKNSGDYAALHLCRLCGKVVRNKWHHYRYHNPEYFKCLLCHTVHNRKDHLKAHMKFKHNIDSLSSTQQGQN